MKYRLLTIFLLCFGSVVYAQHLDITKSINSGYDEQNPVLMPGGTHLFYTIANHPDNVGGVKDKGDIWYSVWQDSIWSLPIHGGKVINNSQWNGVLDFNSDANNMLLHHLYGNGKQGVSVCSRKGNGWSDPEDAKIPYFMNKSKFQSGSLSPDGNVLFLALESYGTIGAEDIYICFRNGAGWTEPKNLGAPINSGFQEMTPIISEDNKTLFFSSNGFGGAGSMDVFKVTRLDDSWMNWSTPENISEVNTSGREQSFTFDPSTKLARYITTQDSDGYGDIRYYQFKDAITDSAIVIVEVDSLIDAQPLKVISYSIEGTVTDKKSRTLISASITISRGNEEQGVLQEMEAINGQFVVALDSAGEYHVKVAAPGYLPHLSAVTLDSLHINAFLIEELNSVSVGESVTLENVLFEQASTELIESSYEDLDNVVELMKDNPTMEIELSGHTDNQGSSKLNLQLSKDRVEVVKKYLIVKGIDAKRIEGTGYGSTRPIASNKNTETRKLNRRVEFVVVKE